LRGLVMSALRYTAASNAGSSPGSSVTAGGGRASPAARRFSARSSAASLSRLSASRSRVQAGGAHHRHAQRRALSQRARHLVSGRHARPGPAWQSPASKATLLSSSPAPTKCTGKQAERRRDGLDHQVHDQP
jgi:hypothetical protein